MSYEKRGKRRSLRKKLRISLISFILIYLIFRSTPIIFANNLKTTTAQIDEFIEEFQVDGVLIRNEEVFKFDGQGLVERKIEEGERVAVGIDIANLNFLRDMSGLKHQLEEIENAIEILSDKDRPDKVFEKDKEKILENKKELINDIQNSINNEDFNKIALSNNDLNFYDKKDSEIFKKNNLLEESIKSLEDKKEVLKKEIKENNISYKTQSSGILSYEIDGYEGIYLPKEFENYTYENLDFPGEPKSKEEANGFKIIDNFTWYLALKVEDSKEINQYKEKDFMNISFMDSEKNIRGKIIQINKTGQNAVVILEFREYFQDYYMNRFSKINVLTSSKRGYKIPKETIIEEDGQKGVFIKDFNGIVKFRPIIIIGEEKEYVFVDMGKFGFIEIPSQEEAVRTIGLYDEMFLKPNKIQEGQIIN